MNVPVNVKNFIIEALGLVKKFGDFTAVKGVKFRVERGECFGLLGPNGAGKSSIVRMVFGFSPVTAGELKVFGENIKTGARDIKKRLGVVAQEDNLDPELTVMQNLLIYAGYFRLKKDEAHRRATEVLDFMELREKAESQVDKLSGGLKRRLTLGRALLNRPELLLLDEPTTGLDPYARHLVWQRLLKLKEQGTTLLLTTHYLEEASKLCDRLVILHRGEILEEGSPQSLIDRHVGREVLEVGFAPDSPYRENPLAFVELLRREGPGTVKNAQVLGENLFIFTNSGNALNATLAKTATGVIPLVYQRLRPTNLEDVFLMLTGQGLENGNNGENTGKANVWGD